MTNRTLTLDDDLYRYLVDVSVRESEVLARLRAETAGMEGAAMQIGAEQGQFMALLVRLIGAQRCLEVGTYTGYSALVCAQALPADGRLVALDISDEWTRVARRYWAEAGVADRIDLRLGPARASLEQMLAAGEQGTYDFMFIDADKCGYADYYSAGLQLVRSGGLILFDNVLWSGAVADEADQSDDTVALRALNKMLHADERIDLSLVPIGDGLTLARIR